MRNEAECPGLWHWLQVITIGRRPKRTLARLVALVVICLITFTFVLIPVRVTGISMEPTYHDHSVNFINRLAYVRREPQRGDVVGVRLSPNPGAGTKIMLLKRVVGLPGEAVSFVGGHVCIDGDVQTEPYLKHVSDWEAPPTSLGPGQYYVVGDNRSMRPEEHEHGKAERAQIVGRVLFTKGP
jgi:signal peptidase I